MNDSFFQLFPNEQYLDLTLFQYGQEQCSPCHSYGPAIRNHYLFHYILSGKGTLYTTDADKTPRTYVLEAGQGFMIFPHMINTYVADQEDPWCYIWIEFDGIRAASLIGASGLTPNTPIYQSPNLDLQSEMLSKLQQIVYAKHPTAAAHIGNLYLFMDALIRSGSQQSSRPTLKRKDLYIKQAISFIEQYYARPDLSLEDAAQYCNLNRSYLGRLFKEKLNQTPQQFLITYRMNKATELMTHSDLSIGEIAKAVGYLNQMNFSRTFRSVYNTSPSSWRKEH